MFTVIASLQSSDCPFQTPVSSMLKRGRQGVLNLLERVPQKISSVLNRVRRGIASAFKQASWACFSYSVRSSIRHTFSFTQVVITRRFPSFLLNMSRRMQNAQLLPNDLESATGSQLSMPSGRPLGPLTLDLTCLDSPVESIGVRSIQWIFDTTTDVDMITAAVRMIPKVEWPDQHNVPDELDRLEISMGALMLHGNFCPLHKYRRRLA